jgi:hypothetical protein
MNYYLIALITAFCSLPMGFLKAQTAAADNKLSKTITFRPIPKGPSVLGVFEGRPPCKGLAEQLRIATDADCAKLKCVLIFYRDSLTMEPAKFTLSISGGGDVVKQEGSSYRQKVLEGKWGIVRGIKSNENAEVYRLDFGKPGIYLYLLKGDDNVLFVLDENKEFRVGNQEFSYTLNRVELVPGKKEARP